VQQIDTAIASLDVPTEDEVHTLISPYTPRSDWQSISDEAEMDKICAQVPGTALPYPTPRTNPDHRE
jgi:hypothetical protein